MKHHTAQRLHGIIASLLTLLSLTASAATTDDGLPIIDIRFQGSIATVSIPSDVTDVMLNSASGNANVVLYSGATEQEYCYRVTGTTTNGSLTIQGNYKLRLLLNGCSITSRTGAAIDIEVGKRVAVVLQAGTTSTLRDATGGLQKAAMYFTGHPEFQGGGNLVVYGNTKHAICAKEYLELKDDLGSITVAKAVSDGIHCGKGKRGNANNYFEMKGGRVAISGTGSDGIDADDYGCVKLKGGTLSIAVDAEEGSAIKCDSLFSIRNDAALDIAINSPNAEGIRCNYEARFTGGKVSITNSGDGSKGIKLKRKTLEEDPTTTVADGGRAYFEGSVVDVALRGNDTAEGDRCMAVSIDGDMALSAGTISIRKLTEECKAYNVKGVLEVSGTGRLLDTGGHYDGEAATTYQNDMQIYAIAKLNGETVTDYANLHVGVVSADDATPLGGATAVTVAGNRTFLELRAYSDTSRPLKFCLFDASDGKAYTAIETASFQADTILGTPSNPFTLTFGTLPGDVNGDGLRTLSDLTALIALLKAGVTDPNATALPEALSGLNPAAADVDQDGAVNLADVDALLQMLLESTTE